MTSVASLLEGKRIVICAGSGGVGKTTTAAALGARDGRARAARRRRDDRPRAAARRPRSGSRSSATSRGWSTRALRRPRRRGRRRAVGDDARRQAHVRLADRAARARRAHARRGVREPDLPAALQRGRGLPGVHGDREALRARPGGRLRPARARHAAVAQRARLPRRAAAAEGLLRRPRDPDVPAPGGAQRQGARARHGAWCSRCSSASPASTCCRTCRCSSARSAG